MTKIKLCGLKRSCDIDYVNTLMPDLIGFVFAPGSKRFLSPDRASALRKHLKRGITPVGVFTDAAISEIEQLAGSGTIEAVQLHGREDNQYIEALRRRVHCPVIQAFHIETTEDVKRAERSGADYIMLDSGGGTGKPFDHSLIGGIGREFFLAGGLDCENVGEAILKYHPYGVDVSSALETDGVKDFNKMAAFVKAVRYGEEAEKCKIKKEGSGYTGDSIFPKRS